MERTSMTGMTSHGQGDSKSSRKSRSRQMASWEERGHAEQQLARMQDADFERWQNENKKLERETQQRSKENQTHRESRRAYYEQEKSYEHNPSGQDVNGTSVGCTRRYRDKISESRYVSTEKYCDIETPGENKFLNKRLQKPVPIYPTEKKYKISEYEEKKQQDLELVNFSNLSRQMCQSNRNCETSYSKMKSYDQIEEEKLRIRNLPRLLDLKITCPSILKEESGGVKQKVHVFSHSKIEESAAEYNSKFISKYSTEKYNLELNGNYHKLQDYSDEEKYPFVTSQRNSEPVKSQYSEPSHWSERMSREKYKKSERNYCEAIKKPSEYQRIGFNDGINMHQPSKVKNSPHTNYTSTQHNYSNKIEHEFSQGKTKPSIGISSDYSLSAFAPVSQKLRINHKEDYNQTFGYKCRRDSSEIIACNTRGTEPKYEQQNKSVKMKIGDHAVDYTSLSDSVLPKYDQERENGVSLLTTGKKILSVETSHVPTKSQVKLSELGKENVITSAVCDKNLSYKPESSGYGPETEEKHAMNTVRVSPLHQSKPIEPCEMSLGRGYNRRKRASFKKSCKAEIEAFIELNIKAGKGIFEYKIAFTPEINSRGVHLYLLNQLKHSLGDTMLLENTTLYLPHQLSQEVVQYYAVHPYDGSKVEVVLKFQGKKAISESTYVFSLLMKQILRKIKLARSSFDPDLPQFRCFVRP